MSKVLPAACALLLCSAAGHHPLPPAHVLAPAGPLHIRGELRLQGNARYELRHTLFLDSGTISLGPGARVEAAPGAAVVIGREGRIHAEGTVTRPVIFTCRGLPQAGCWRGLVLNGLAHVNTGSPGSPIVPGRDAAGGCLEGMDANGGYGGCADGDDSGTLRHVWIQHAGGSGDAALSLNALGASTRIEHVHVYASAGPGIAVRGGAVNLKRLRVVAPTGAALAWTEGWRGKAQFGVIQAGPHTTHAIDGANSPAAPDALPRSAPVLRNFTIAGPPTPTERSGAAAIHLRDGTAAQLEAFLLVNQPATAAYALDIDGVETWNQFRIGTIRIAHSLIAGFDPLGSSDPDTVTVTGLFSPDVEGQYLRAAAQNNRVIVAFDTVARVVRAAYGTLQDLRPPPFSATCQAPAAHEFFEAATYCGGFAADPIPWSEPGPVLPLSATVPTHPYGHLTVYITSPTLGDLGGVRVVAEDLSLLGTTDVTGYAYLYVRAGWTAYRLQHLPAACADPGILVIDVQPQARSGQTVVLECSG